MIFAVDIGNTNITIGIIDTEKIKHVWRLSSDIDRTKDEFLLIFKNLLSEASYKAHDIEGSIFSCVLPPISTPMNDALLSLFEKEPICVEPGIRIGLKINYHPIGAIGADRVVNAVAANALYSAPLIIVDFGTATTFCVLDEFSNYIGGIIFPGVNTIANALYKSAALLPRVAFKKPEKLIGQTTVNSIQSGLFYGYHDMIKGTIDRIRSETNKELRVIATGGLGKYFSEQSELFDDYCPNLTLIGLQIIYTLNTQSPDNNTRW